MANSHPGFFSSVRDFFAAGREFAIVAFIVLLLFKPEVIRNALQNAGIKNFGGIEFWDQAVADSDTAIDADITIKHLQEELDEIAGKLDGANQVTPEKLKETLTKLREESDETREKLQSRISQQATFLESAPVEFRMRTGDKLQKIQSYRAEEIMSPRP